METETRTTQAKEPEKPAKKLIFIAHAANSAEAIKKALEAGVDFVEIDIWKAPTRGELAVIHQGLAGVFGFGHKLEDVLTRDIVETDGHLYFDLKWGGDKAGYQLMKFLRQRKYPCKPTISSTDWQTLLNLSQRQGVRPHYTISTGFDLTRFKAEIKKYGQPPEKGISICHSLLTPREIQYFSDQGFEIFAWTVDDLKRIKELQELGVDGIVTNNLSLSLTDR